MLVARKRRTVGTNGAPFRIEGGVAEKLVPRQPEQLKCPLVRFDDDTVAAMEDESLGERVEKGL